jgi:hypothetical protein
MSWLALERFARRRKEHDSYFRIRSSRRGEVELRCEKRQRLSQDLNSPAKPRGRISGVFEFRHDWRQSTPDGLPPRLQTFGSTSSASHPNAMHGPSALNGRLLSFMTRFLG